MDNDYPEVGMHHVIAVICQHRFTYGAGQVGCGCEGDDAGPQAQGAEDDRMFLIGKRRLDEECPGSWDVLTERTSFDKTYKDQLTRAMELPSDYAGLGMVEFLGCYPQFSWRDPAANVRYMISPFLVETSLGSFAPRPEKKYEEFRWVRKGEMFLPEYNRSGYLAHMKIHTIDDEPMFVSAFEQKTRREAKLEQFLTI